MVLAFAAAVVLLQQGNDAIVPVSRSDAGWMNRHGAMVTRAMKGNVDLVFVGDSITHAFGGEPDTGENFANRGMDTWNTFYGDRHALNLGISGDRTQHVLWRLDNGELAGTKPKVAVVMIGTNNVGSNTPAQIAEGVEAVCAKVKQKAPSAKVLLLAIFPRGKADSAERKAVKETNELLAAWAKTAKTTFLDIGKVFLDANGEIPTDVMPDQLHPFAFGYRKWAMAMEPTLAKMLGQKPKTTDSALNSALVPVTQNRDYQSYDWMNRHRAVLAEVKSHPKTDLVFIGDSITHRFGGPPSNENLLMGKAAWDEFYGKRNALDLGFGWDRTENVLWRIENGELNGIQPKVVVLNIGTNNLGLNTTEEIRAGVAAIIREIRERMPKTRILLLGVFPRGQNPDDPMRIKVTALNKQLAVLDKTPNVTYLDLGAKFLEPDGAISAEVMNDYLHPTEKGYRIWAEGMEPTLSQWLGKLGIGPRF